MYRLCLWSEQMESFNHRNSNVVTVTTLRLSASALIVIIETRGAVGSRGWSRWLSFSFLKQWQYQWPVFLHALFHSTHIPMFTVLDPLLEFTYHLLSYWRKFALCIQSLLCLLFLSGWPPCQDSGLRTQDSGLRTGLFNTKLHWEILHQDYIAKQY